MHCVSHTPPWSTTFTAGRQVRAGRRRHWRACCGHQGLASTPLQTLPQTLPTTALPGPRTGDAAEEAVGQVGRGPRAQVGFKAGAAVALQRLCKGGPAGAVEVEGTGGVGQHRRLRRQEGRVRMIGLSGGGACPARADAGWPPQTRPPAARRSGVAKSGGNQSAHSPWRPRTRTAGRCIRPQTWSHCPKSRPCGGNKRRVCGLTRPGVATPRASLHHQAGSAKVGNAAARGPACLAGMSAPPLHLKSRASLTPPCVPIRCPHLSKLLGCSVGSIICNTATVRSGRGRQQEAAACSAPTQPC